MNENENDFEALRRLLALKRHEIPPPGYFDRFPGAVMARLRANQSGAEAGVAERLEDRLPWLFRIIRALEYKPAFAISFASALCLLLLAGVVFAERPEVTTVQPLMQSAQDVSPLNIASAVPAGQAAEPVGLQAGFIDNTNPAFSQQPMGGMSAVALFGGQNVFAQPVNLILPGN
jgi:hypothetical protein